MSTPGTASKRDRLVDSAAALFHQKGMVSTSLADIAKHADIPIGNVYYYFKTKDELALAALDKRRRSMEEVCAMLDSAVEDPRERLVELTRIFTRAKDDYTRHGCPVYRIIIDSENEKDPVAKAAAGIYSFFLDWAEKQFSALGSENAKRQAASLLAGIQGGAVVARAMADAQVMDDELERIIGWIEALPNKKIFLGKAAMAKKAESA